jgi:hypothetical protein
MKIFNLLCIILLSTSMYSQTLFNNHFLNNNDQKRENLPLKNIIVNHYEKYIVLGHQVDRNAIPTDFTKTVLTFINNSGSITNALEVAVNDTISLNGQCFAAYSSEEYIVAGSTNEGNARRAMAFKINVNGGISWAYHYDGIEIRQIEYVHADIFNNRYFIMTGIYKDTSNIDRVMAIKINQNGIMSWAYYYYPQNNPTLTSEVPKSVLVERDLITIAGTRTNYSQDLFRLQIDYNGNILSPLLNFDYGLNEKEPFISKYKGGYLFSFTAEDNDNDSLLTNKHAVGKFYFNWNPYWTHYYGDYISLNHTANAIHDIPGSHMFATAGTSLRVDSLSEPYYFAIDTNGTLLYQAHYPDTFGKSTSYFMPVDTGFVLYALDHNLPLSYKFNLIILNTPGNSICYEDHEFFPRLKYPEIGNVDFLKDSIKMPDSLFLEAVSPFTFIYDCSGDSVHKFSPSDEPGFLRLARSDESYITLDSYTVENQNIELEVFDVLGRRLERHETTLLQGYNEIQVPIHRSHQIIIVKVKFNNQIKVFKILH